MKPMTDQTNASSEHRYREPRRFAGINGLGLWTLYKREVGRFIKVGMQTLLAPAVSTLLLMTVFKLAFVDRVGAGGEAIRILNSSYEEFLAPGLIIMAILQNAFQNSSSSLTIAKVQGSTVDFLMPPLSPLELTMGFVAGAATRGVVVGLITGLAIKLFGLAELNISHLWAIVWFSLAASFILGAIGAAGGIWADKFDHLAAVSNFVIVPLTFLSGTFYDVNTLVEPFTSLAHWDPFFYLIDGFRYGFLGEHNSNIGIGVAVTGALTVLSCGFVWWLFKSGYKLKA